jgi:AcrR family transcriptional regulator
MNTAISGDQAAAVRPRGRPRDPGVDEGILHAALDLITEGGFEKLSMEAVAARAGVAKASIYRRFPSKVDLIVAMCQAFGPAIQPAPDTGSFRGDLEFLVGSLNDSMCPTTDTGRLMPSMVSAAKENNPEVKEAMQQFTAARRRRILDVVKAGIDRGDVRADADPDAIGDLLVGAMMYRIVIRNGKVDKKFRTSLVDGLIGGFGAESASD